MKRIFSYLSWKAWAGSLAAIGVVAIAILLVAGDRHSVAKGSGRVGGFSEGRTEGDAGDDSATIRVKAISPKCDPKLEVTVEEPAYVEAYNRANLEARVAGPIKFLEKAQGAFVKAGETLIQIDVPDVEQEVLVKQAMVLQRQKELDSAKQAEKIANAAVDTARKGLSVAQLQVVAATEEQDYRQREYKRYEKLGSGSHPAVYGDVVDERLKWANVAKANKATADAEVEKAGSLVTEAEEKRKGADADVELKESLVKVAEADVKQAQARLDLATLKAPWDGEIVDRNVDPGTFVHSAATTERGKPLLTLQRTDLVTVVMKVPDTYASFVTDNCAAIIEMKELRGQQFRARVTRKTNTLQNAEDDRTMRVEVDLFNLPAERWAEFQKRAEAHDRAGLKNRTLPQLPTVNGEPGTDKEHLLIPGMYGRMKLVINSLKNVFLVPSQVIVRQGGTPYVYLVENGIVHRTQVAVDLDDGKLARIRLLVKEGDHLVARRLTGNEVIVSSNEGELSDGQPVEASHEDW